MSPRQFEDAGQSASGLATRGWLSPTQVEDLRRRLGVAAGAFPNIPPFGAIAVRKGFVAAEMMEEIVRNQTRLVGRGVRFHLGELLIRRGLLTIAQALDVLAEQGITLLACARCQSQYNVFGARDASFPCPACDIPLAPPQQVSTLEVRGTLNKPLTLD